MSTIVFAGFLVWEFPTVYISQKLRIGKYLGEREKCGGGELFPKERDFAAS